MSLITNSFSLQFIYQLFYMGQNKQLFIIFPGTDMNAEDKETQSLYGRYLCSYSASVVSRRGNFGGWFMLE